MNILHGPGWEIAVADVTVALRELPECSVHTVITSVPYWGLRDYGTAKWEGGDAACDHLAPPKRLRARCGRCGAKRIDEQIGLEPHPDLWVKRLVAVCEEIKRVLRDDGTLFLNVGDSYASGALLGDPRGGNRDRGRKDYPEIDSVYCGRCDGRSGSRSSRSVGNSQLAHEPASRRERKDRDTERADSSRGEAPVSPRTAPVSTTPGSSPRSPAGHLRCRSCGRRLSGGRSSSRGESPSADRAEYRTGSGRRASEDRIQRRDASGSAFTQYKQKDLIGQPWMLAFALRAAGWYLRADIIYAKKNAMPESIKDRPTKSHEYVFLLSKKAAYFYDADAIREERSAATIERDKYGRTNTGERIASHKPGASPANGSAGITSNYKASGAQGRNVRSVWSISTARFDEGHFATFPPELPERCIKAGTSEKGVCPICGAPWVRVVARGPVDPAWQAACGGDANGEYAGRSAKHEQAEPAPFANGAKKVQNPAEVKARILAGLRERRTVGWKPTCGCSPLWKSVESMMGIWDPLRACADPTCRHAIRSHGRDHTQCGHCRCHVFRWGDPYDPVPATVLDPFSGAATTGLVALRLGRRYLGVELSPKYAEISKRRLEADIADRAAAAAAQEFGITEPTAIEQKAMASQLKLFGGE